jgi:hypothetical protein
MIITLPSGPDNLLPGSVVTLDPSRAPEAGPYTVTAIDPIKDTFDGHPSDGSADLPGCDVGLIVSVDNSALGYQEFDFGGGNTDVLLPGTVKIVQAMQQLITDLESGATVKSLQAALDAANAQIAQLQSNGPALSLVQQVLAQWPTAGMDALNKIQAQLLAFTPPANETTPPAQTTSS